VASISIALLEEGLLGVSEGLFSVSWSLGEVVGCVGMEAMALLNWSTAEVISVRSSAISVLSDFNSAAYSGDGEVTGVDVGVLDEVVDEVTTAAGTLVELLES